MPLPAGMTTRTVTISVPLDALGNPATSIRGTIRADRYLRWAATGETIYQVPAKLPSPVNGVITTTLAVVDQAGVVDSTGNPITNWSYTLELVATWSPKTTQTISKTFQVVAADVAPVDLDAKPFGETTPPVLSDPYVRSVAGLSGPLSAQQVVDALGTPLSAAIVSTGGSVFAPKDGVVTVGKTAGFNFVTSNFASDDLAVQAAVDAFASGFTGGGRIVLGPGVWDFVGGVNAGGAKKNIHISGAGPATIVRWKNGNTFADATAGANYLFTLGSYSTLTDLQLRGQSTFTCPINGVNTFTAGGTNTLGGGILVTDGRTWLNRVYVTAMAEDGIANKGGIGTKYDSVMIIGCGGTGLNVTNVIGPNNTYATDGDYSSVWIGSCGVGMTIAGAGGWISGAHIWGCQGDGLVVNTDAVRVLGCYLESNGGWGLNINARTRVTVVGNDIFANGIAGSQKGGVVINGPTAVNNIVSDNLLRDNRYYAVWINGGSYNSVAGNVVSDSYARSITAPDTAVTYTASGAQTTTTTFTDANAPSWMADAMKAIGMTLVITGAGAAGAAFTAQVVGWNSPTSATLSLPMITATTDPSYVVRATAYGIRETGVAKNNAIRGNIVHKNDCPLGSVAMNTASNNNSYSHGNVGWDAPSWFEAGSQSGAVSIDARNGTEWHGTLVGNVTSIAFFPSGGLQRGTTLRINFTQSGTGGFTVAGWPATVKWAGGGSAPTFATAANANGTVTLRYDGTNWIEIGRSV